MAPADPAPRASGVTFCTKFLEWNNYTGGLQPKTRRGSKYTRYYSPALTKRLLVLPYIGVNFAEDLIRGIPTYVHADLVDPGPSVMLNPT